ncbi:hypothetical protein DFS34DRAFT_611621 [Phlyctochytrium arcticum]|nr:hypothetical protein DFS34DRAFT_611621 [Phlyctochytrium arcticum]
MVNAMNNAWVAVLKQPFTKLPPVAPDAFKNKTAIITGGNTGIGLATAHHLLSGNIKKVIITSRSPEKGEAARQLLLKDAEGDRKANESRVEVWALDMNSYASIHQFVDRVNTLPALDLLYLNAGVFVTRLERAPTGYESTIQVNILSTSLLALLLLPKLIAQGKQTVSGPDDVPRLIITSSGLHAVAALPKGFDLASQNLIDTYNDEKIWKGREEATGNELYAISKLYNIVLAQSILPLIPSISPKSSSPSVIVSTTCPGFCESELIREPGVFINMFRWIFGRTALYGALSLAMAGQTPPEETGLFVWDGTRTYSGGLSAGPNAEKLRAKLWAEVVSVLKKQEPNLKLTF